MKRYFCLSEFACEAFRPFFVVFLTENIALSEIMSGESYFLRRLVSCTDPSLQLTLHGD